MDSLLGGAAIAEDLELHQLHLATLTDGPASRDILRSMTARHLLHTACGSAHHFQLVSAYLQTSYCQRIEGTEWKQRDCERFTASTDASPSGGNFPTEIGLHIVQQLSISDRARTAQSCPPLHALVSESLRSAATTILARFHLGYREVTLLQAATGTVIGGSGPTALLQFYHRPYLPDNLDFYVPANSVCAALAFFERSGYSIKARRLSHELPRGVSDSFIMQCHSMQVNVWECSTRHPLDAILQSHSTPVYSAWAFDSAWHGYPRLTWDGGAITTRSLMPPVDGIIGLQASWRILEKYTRRNFSYTFGELDRAHDCGVHPECPMTPRVTTDAACANVPFPPPPYYVDGPKHPPVAWILHGAGCCRGILAGGARSPTYSRDSAWATTLRKLLDHKTLPLPYQHNLFTYFSS